VGVVQLLNKKQHRKITLFDLKKIQSIQELLGMMVENTSEIDSSINIAIGVKEKINNIRELAGNSVFEKYQ